MPSKAIFAWRAYEACGGWAKTALWAADVHIAENLLPEGQLPLGSHLEASLGDDYVSFAITAFESEVPRGPGVCEIATRHPGSAEERLAAYGHETLLAIPRGARNDEVMPLGWWTYRPFADFDGIFFLEHSPSMHPLQYAACP